MGDLVGDTLGSVDGLSVGSMVVGSAVVGDVLGSADGY